MVCHHQQQPKSPGDGGGDRDSREHNRGSGSVLKSGRGRRGGRRRAGKSGGPKRLARRKGITDDEQVQPPHEHDELQKTIHMTSSRDVVLLYLQYGIYDSPVPASFLRSAPSILAHAGSPPFSPRAISTYKPEEYLTIVLTSEIGHGATGVAHRGTLELEASDSAVPLDVVVRLAFRYEQRDVLRGEYEVYRRLKSKGVIQGIPTVLGLFDDSEDAACALVMLYAGASLVAEPQRTLSVSDRKSALSTLESIHRAGILHGDIRQENILVGDLGVTIIDFGHSERCNNQGAKDKELAQLRHVLGLARKKKVTTEDRGS